MWRDGIQDSQVLFIPNKNGRFLITWVLLDVILTIYQAR